MLKENAAMRPLVSIITPCYNGEAFLDQYFEAILSQTYENLELIFVNDGANDRTQDIALSYKAELESRDIKFKYRYQPNGGQANALNTGLKEITGEYLIWPDSDDLLSPDSIEKRVAFLEENPEFAWVRSDADAIDFDTGKVLYHFAKEADKCSKDIYLDLIVEDTYCCCGCYMVRVAALRTIYPDLKIYESSQGQNWQILIPMAAQHICGYVDGALYHYMVRNNSHSHQKRTMEETLNRYAGLEDILRRSVELSDRHDRDYERILYLKSLRTRLRVYLEYRDMDNAKIYYDKLRQANALGANEKRIYMELRHPIRYKLYLFGLLMKRIYRKLCGSLAGSKQMVS